MKTLRTQLGFTQQQFAALIGVSRPVITLYEKGLRNLPAKASLQLAQIQLLMLQNKKNSGQTNVRLVNQQQAEYSKAEKLLKAHARKAAARIQRLTMKIKNMQERYTQLSQKLAFVQLLMQEAIPATRQMSLLENIEINILDAMKYCSPVRQLMAEYRLQNLQALQQAATDIINRIQKINTSFKNS